MFPLSTPVFIIVMTSLYIMLRPSHLLNFSKYCKQTTLKCKCSIFKRIAFV